MTSKGSTGRIFVATNYLGNLKKSPIDIGCIPENLFERETWRNEIFTKYIVKRKRMRHWLYTAHINLIDLRNIFQNGLKLMRVFLQVLLVQCQPCQFGDLTDLIDSNFLSRHIGMVCTG